MVMEARDIAASLACSSLGTSFIGCRVLYYPSIPSVMDMARQAAREGAMEGVVVFAGEQTAGRGREGRRWFSSGSDLALSVLLRPAVSRLPLLAMVAPLAVVRAINAVTGLEAVIKWPNDVLIGDRKVCGILIESSFAGKENDYAVVGIGINCNLDPAALPEISSIATSLFAELGQVVAPLSLARPLLREMEHLYLSEGLSVYGEWRARLDTLGKRVQVKTGQQVISGIAWDVAEDGSLLLRRSDGSTERILAGDVTQLRHDQGE